MTPTPTFSDSFFPHPDLREVVSDFMSVSSVEPKAYLRWCFTSSTQQQIVTEEACNQSINESRVIQWLAHIWSQNNLRVNSAQLFISCVTSGKLLNFSEPGSSSGQWEVATRSGNVWVPRPGRPLRALATNPPRLGRVRAVPVSLLRGDGSGESEPWSPKAQPRAPPARPGTCVQRQEGKERAVSCVALSPATQDSFRHSKGWKSDSSSPQTSAPHEQAHLTSSPPGSSVN